MLPQQAYINYRDWKFIKNSFSIYWLSVVFPELNTRFFSFLICLKTQVVFLNIKSQRFLITILITGVYKALRLKIIGPSHEKT